jgi:hypothetical protein
MCRFGQVMDVLILSGVASELKYWVDRFGCCKNTNIFNGLNLILNFFMRKKR